MSNLSKIMLSAPVTNYYYDPILKRLYFSMPALEEGVWTGLNGETRFYPRDVIRKSAPLFKNLDLVDEHTDRVVGKTGITVPTELGFNVKNAYLDDPIAIDEFLSGDKRGLSIKAHVNEDPIRKTIKSIFLAQNIALVRYPACQTCKIKNYYGNAIMSEKIDESEEFITSKLDIQEETISLAADEVAPSITTDADDTEAVDDIKIESVIEQSVPPEPIIDESTTIEPIIITPSMDDMNAVKDVVVTATNTMEAIAVQLSSVTAKLQEMEVALSTTKSELANSQIENEQYKTQIAELSMKLNSIESSQREKLIAEIKEIDPEMDNSILAGFTIVQLSTFKSNLQRIISKGMIGGERKSIKVDEKFTKEVNLSAPKKLDRITMLNASLSYLKAEQKRTYSKAF